MPLIHTLRIHQQCGPVSITYDVVTKRTTIRTLYNAVAYVHSHDGAIDLYGLGNCTMFEFNHKRYHRYIEDSRIRVKNGAIFENKMRRSRFTPPSTTLRLRAIFEMRLRSIDLGGVATLKEVAPQCVDSESAFNLHLQMGTRLATGLPVMAVRCILEGGSVIAAATEHSPTSRLLWQLSVLELVVNGQARVSGIHVTRRLHTTFNAGTQSTMDVSVDDECEVTTRTNVVQSVYDPFMGRMPPPPQRPVINEHGMMVWEDVPPEEAVPQEVLDASRAAYEEEAPAASAAPLFTLTGNTKCADKAVDDADKTCRVCMTNRAVVVMTGCGHTATCVSCAETLRYCASTCPLCRAEIGIAVVPFV